MLFNSVEFIVFFTCVFFLYYSISHSWRWLLLLIASYVFYMSWNAAYLLLIVGSTLIDYFTGWKMGQEPVKAKRRKYLYLSLASNLGILFFFKYFNFFSESVHALASAFSMDYAVPLFQVLLPVGISFYTFQTLSYSIDIFHGKISPEKHLGRFALFVAFFPQLVAGPIERSGNLLPQLRQKQLFDYPRIISGMRLAAWGLFKKVVIADRLAIFVDQVYNAPGEYAGFAVLVATIFFAFQIYCDFSGYSDIAIGVARMLGIDLMKNFDRPYFSQSLGEFWRRWHISLSTWFRDYVYIPLGGNRVVKWRWYYNLFLTFLVSGLWHGANWTFVIWGAIHGLILIAEQMNRERIKQGGWQADFPLLTRRLLNIGFTFAIVCLAWVFFRANTVSDAWVLLVNMAHLSWDQWSLNMINDNSYDFVLSFFFIAILVGLHVFQENRHMGPWVASRPVYVRWAIYLVLVSLILNFGEFNQQEFIYFQF